MRPLAFLAIFFLLLANLSPVLAQADSSGPAQAELPPALQRIQEYNLQYAQEFSQSATFLIVFVAGLISFLAPCSVALLPAFFAYTFKEKKEITKATLLFFAGFSTIFVALGLIAGYIGESIISIQAASAPFILIIGILLIAVGIFTLIGKGIPSPIKLGQKYRKTALGNYLFGLTFALGWTACLGPILSGILLIVTVLKNFLYAGFLLFVYSLGIFIPLFIFAYFYDRLKLSQKMLGKEISFEFLGRRVVTHTTNIIAGALFIFVGIVFVLFRNTEVFISADIFGTVLLYGDLQRALLDFGTLANILGVLLLLVVIVLIFRAIRKSKHSE